MTVIELAPPENEILDFVHQQIMSYRQDGVEARYLVVGTEAYPRLCREISVSQTRGKGEFETYSRIPIVVDPFRSDTVCVLPSPSECARGVDGHRA